MKKLLLITLGIIIVIIGGFVIYQDHQTELKMNCTDSKHLDYINHCMEIGHLYPQEQYDAYYNVAKNPSLNILNNNLFFLSFSLSYNNCDVRKETCNLYDKDIYTSFIKQCTFNAEENLYCTSNYFNTIPPDLENIKHFVKIVQHEIKQNKIKNDPIQWSCNNSYQYFYYHIEKDLMYLVPLEVQKTCIIKQ